MHEAVEGAVGVVGAGQEVAPELACGHKAAPPCLLHQPREEGGPKVPALADVRVGGEGGAGGEGYGGRLAGPRAASAAIETPSASSVRVGTANPQK